MASLCVPSMAQFLLVKVQSRVITAKRSEPQAVRAYEQKPDEAKWRVRLQSKSKPKR